ncbi:MAG: hypothetical protein N3B14_09815 [Thermoleophilia bacterium]|nr:hypothetical protein [Thermoleophilia bacterium]
MSQAITFYEEALNLLQPDKITDEAKEWLKDFDYINFFRQKVSLGVVPNRPDIWNRIADWSRSGHPANSVHHVVALLHEVSDVLALGEASLTTIRRVVSLMGELMVFGVMVAVLNDVAPLECV